MKVALFLVALVAVASAGDVPKKVIKMLAWHHLMDSCWGKENMKAWYELVGTSMKKCQNLTPTFDLDVFGGAGGNPGLFGPAGQQNEPTGFNRFGAGVNQITNPYEAWMAFLAFQQSQKQNGARRFRREISAEERLSFMEDIAEYKDMKVDVIGNLTCILADLGALDSNLQVNLKWYTQDVWADLPGAVDPQFKNAINEKVEDCYEIAQSIPQSILNKNPIYKKFGRNMIFFKCQHKAEINLCAKQDILRYLQEKYGVLSSAQLQAMGLPADPYDAALFTKKVMWNSKSDVEKKVAKMLFGFQE